MGASRVEPRRPRFVFQSRGPPVPSRVLGSKAAAIRPLTAWIDRTIFGQAQPVVQATRDERPPSRSPRSDEDGEGDYVSARDGPTLRWEDRRPWKRAKSCVQELGWEVADD